MHKYLVVFFIFFNAFVSFSQTETVVSTKTLRVSNAAVAFNQNIPIGTLIFNIAKNRLFIAKTGVESTNTLTTAIASFELLNDVVNDSYAITTVGDYTTALTKGGTLLVSPESGATVTITLTTSGVAIGKRYSVKKANETDGTVKVVTQSGSIEGTTSIETNVPYQGWILQFDGVNWHIIGHI